MLKHIRHIATIWFDVLPAKVYCKAVGEYIYIYVCVCMCLCVYVRFDVLPAKVLIDLAWQQIYASCSVV